MFLRAIALSSIFGWSATIGAAPTAAIGCPVQALSAQQRTQFGATMVDGSPQQSIAVHDSIIKAGVACAKDHHWSKDRLDAAATWAMWQVMESELERRSGLAAADITIVRGYYEEKPDRVGDLAHYSDAQVQQLIDALRGHGAHLHDRGNATVRELGMLMALKEMKAQESAFDAP